MVTTIQESVQKALNELFKEVQIELSNTTRVCEKEAYAVVLGIIDEKLKEVE